MQELTALLGALSSVGLAACTSLSMIIEPTASAEPIEATASPFEAASSPSAATSTRESTQALLGPPIPRLEPGQPVTITWVNMLDQSTGWALGGQAGSSDHVLRTEDGGATWLDVTPPDPMSGPNQPGKDARISILNREVAWAVYCDKAYQLSEDASLWRTRDGGQTWQLSPAMPFGESGDRCPGAPQFVDEQNGWSLVHLDAGMGHKTVDLFRTVDAGVSWTRVIYGDGPDGSLALCNGSTALVFVTGEAGWLLEGCDNLGRPYVDRTDDAGASWQYLDYPAPASQPELFDGFSAYCETAGEDFLGPAAMIFALDCRDAGSFLYRTEDSGQSWSALPYPGGGLEFLDSNLGWALGKTLYRTDDGGRTRTKIKTVAWDGDFSFVDAEHGWAVARLGEEIALVRTQDGGETWEQLEPRIAP